MNIFHANVTRTLVLTSALGLLGCSSTQTDTTSANTDSGESHAAAPAATNNPTPATGGASLSTLAQPESSSFDKPGYVTFVDDGRLWIFREGSEDLKQFHEHGEPAKSVIRPGAGPNGMTVKSVDGETIDGYMLSKPGYVTFIDDGRVWILRDGSEDLAQFQEHGEPAKSVIRPGAGPNRMTVKSVDGETIDGYMLSKPGYVTFIEDGRLWILREGSEDLAQFQEHGEPAKVVIRPGAGPNRMTVKSVDAETIDGYMAAR